LVAEAVRRPSRVHVGRPASWAPVGEFRLYRAWGDLPKESGLRRRFLAWLLGGWQQLLYIGITERTTIARWAEHMKDKWWAPDIATWERDTRVWGSRVDVEAAEEEAIWRERPVHNIAHNGSNPGAVRVRRHLPAHVGRARLRFALWFGLWLFVAVGLGLVAAVKAHVPARDALVVGVGGASALVGWLLYLARPKRRRGRRAW
jgi:hypothetical protein